MFFALFVRPPYTVDHIMAMWTRKEDGDSAEDPATTKQEYTTEAAVHDGPPHIEEYTPDGVSLDRGLKARHITMIGISYAHRQQSSQ